MGKSYGTTLGVKHGESYGTTLGVKINRKSHAATSGV